MAQPVLVTKGQFRLVLALTLLTEVAGAVLYVAGQSSLPPAVQSYVRSGSVPLQSPVAFCILGVAGFILFAAAIIGLFCLWRPARLLLVLLWAVVLATTPLLGPSADTGWAAAVCTLGALLWGIVIALVFFSPVAAFFARNAERPDAHTAPLETGTARGSPPPPQ